jgi:hypothetical protein
MNRESYLCERRIAPPGSIKLTPWYTYSVRTFFLTPILADRSFFGLGGIVVMDLRRHRDASMTMKLAA